MRIEADINYLICEKIVTQHQLVFPQNPFICVASSQKILQPISSQKCLVTSQKEFFLPLRVRLPSPTVDADGGEKDIGDVDENEKVLTYVVNTGTTAATGKPVLGTANNFTCTDNLGPAVATNATTDDPSARQTVQQNCLELLKTTEKGDHPDLRGVVVGADIKTPMVVAEDKSTRAQMFMTSTPVQNEPGHTQEPNYPDSEAGMVDKDTSGQNEVFSGAVRQDCHHVRRGRCLVHGEKAVKKFRPSWVNTVGPGGELVRTYRRKMYWQCDVGPMKGVILKQRQLSVSGTTGTRSQGTRDTVGAGVESGSHDFSSTTARQVSRGCVQVRKGTI